MSAYRLLMDVVIPSVGVFLLGSLVLKLLIEWKTTCWWKKTLSEIRRGESKPTVFASSIVWNSEFFCVRNDKTLEESPRFRWKNIAKVTAFKRDLWTYDCICVCFETLDETAFILNEEINGWCDFFEEMPKYLSDAKPFSVWIWGVASPAFATNITEIFLGERSPQLSEN
jgi:hypothetical protein